MYCDCTTCVYPNREIQSHQMRHSDGLGNYHVVCEWEQVRLRTNKPSYRQVRTAKFLSGFEEVETPTSRVYRPRRPLGKALPNQTNEFADVMTKSIDI